MHASHTWRYGWDGRVRARLVDGVCLVFLGAGRKAQLLGYSLSLLSLLLGWRGFPVLAVNTHRSLPLSRGFRSGWGG